MKIYDNVWTNVDGNEGFDDYEGNDDYFGWNIVS
jgi:hypothetical protein